MLHFILLVKEPGSNSLIFCPNCEGQIQKIYTDDLSTITFNSTKDPQSFI